MAKLSVIPVTFKRACEFVASLHRHNKPPRGHKFSIGLHQDEYHDGEAWVSARLVGVAMAGRPVARHFDDGKTLEVNRTCTDGSRNANSMLYGAIWRAAKAMGYTRCITYTQHDESGASLRAAGWVRIKELAARKGWADSTANEEMKAKRDPIGNGGVARVLWEIRCGAYGKRQSTPTTDAAIQAQKDGHGPKTDAPQAKGSEVVQEKRDDEDWFFHPNDD